MDFSKKIKLFFGNHPVIGADMQMQEALDYYKNHFCAVFVETDLPWDFHNKAIDDLLLNEPNVNPFTINSLGLAQNSPTAKNADSLRGSGFRVGGVFFKADIAGFVTAFFKNAGYEIEKEYL